MGHCSIVGSDETPWLLPTIVAVVLVVIGALLVVGLVVYFKKAP